ncbi:hypothetical protein, partial [Clostridioides difficile]|uniref:hypothetical protein n=1 Tax=Clostridioides difficile TaxID=1496 RepID=UPI003F8CF4A4
MNKLFSIIRYECATSFKYIWIFYAVQYAIVLLVLSITNMVDMKIGTLETNSLIYISIVGVLGLKEEFKMLIQHGFTRKYIFTATLALFVFISGIMAMVDTILGNMLHHFLQWYPSLYGSIYGYENIGMNFLWLFLVYMLICSLTYLVI